MVAKKNDGTKYEPDTLKRSVKTDTVICQKYWEM